MRTTACKVIAIVLIGISLLSIATPIIGAIENGTQNTENYSRYEDSNDGEIMYRANFNGDGRYNFNLKESSGSVDTSDGDAFTLSIGSTGKVTTAGGPISGLPMNGGESYTVEFSIAMEEGSSTHYLFFDPDNRYGFGIRRDKMTIEGKGYAFSYEVSGWITYADPIASESLTVENRNFNKYNFRVIIDNVNKAVRFYYLNQNGVWVLSEIGTNFTPDTETLNLYFGAYTAEKKAIFSDVKVYKGNPYAEYDNAENLDLLYKVDFKEQKYLYANINNNVATSTPSEDGNTLALISNATADGYHCVGGEVYGLPIDCRSLYTVDFSTTLPHTGFVGLAPAATANATCGGYGFALKSAKAKRETSDFSNGKMSSWDNVTNIANIDGKYSFRLVIDGSNKTVALYYLNTSNLWIKLNVTGEGFKQVTDSLYLCFGNYSKNNTLISDVSIYKGDLCNEISKADIDIPEGKQAVYECDINYQGEPLKISHGRNELFSISNKVIELCGIQTAGNYGNGKYHVKLSIAPDQKMTVSEITLPGGAVIRRGNFASVTHSGRITVSSLDKSCISNPAVTYEGITVCDYILDVNEPQFEGFGAKVYNLVTSFTDARYDRAFAWTALDSFVGNGDMAVRYREQGGEWKTVIAVKEALSDSNALESYFKADIAILKADTTYEYQIGKKDSADYTNDWSKVYAFKTAEKNISKFSFIMTGDNQSQTWGNRTNATKGGYMYTQAAINAAIQAVDPAFIMNVGDMVESKAPQVNDEWNLFFKSMGEYAATIPHFAAIGNHEQLAPEYFDTHFNHPNNGGSAAVNKSILTSGGVATADNTLDETIYSFDYGDVHFIVLNSGANYQVVKGQYEAMLNAQKDWLINDLKANSDAKWTILVTHQNVYTVDSGESNLAWLSDVIESYGVDLVFQGHFHRVTRSYPMKNGKIATKTSPNLITKGTGTTYLTIGSTTYNHDTDYDISSEMLLNATMPYSEQPTYTSVEVEGDKLIVTIKQLNGLVLDRFTLVDTSEPDEPDDNGGDSAGADNASPDTGTEDNTDVNPSVEATAVETTAEEKKKKGCGSALSGIGVLLTTSTFGLAAMIRKRRRKSRY